MTLSYFTFAYRKNPCEKLAQWKIFLANYESTQLRISSLLVRLDKIGDLARKG